MPLEANCIDKGLLPESPKSNADKIRSVAEWLVASALFSWCWTLAISASFCSTVNLLYCCKVVVKFSMLLKRLALSLLSSLERLWIACMIILRRLLLSRFFDAVWLKASIIERCKSLGRAVSFSIFCCK